MYLAYEDFKGRLSLRLGDIWKVEACQIRHEPDTPPF